MRRASSSSRVSLRSLRIRSSAALRYIRCGDWSPAAPVQPSTGRSLPCFALSDSRTSCQKSASTVDSPSTSCDGQATLTAVAISLPPPSQKNSTSTPWSSGPSMPRKSGLSVAPYISARPSA